MNVRKKGEGNQNRTSTKKGGWGSKFWSFCNNVIIKCPHTASYQGSSVWENEYWIYWKKHFMCTFYNYLNYIFFWIFVDAIDNKKINHENKFNRKAFHEQENSENWFSEFSCFMKGNKKYFTDILR